MKRFYIVAVLLVIAASFFACSGQGKGQGSPVMSDTGDAAVVNGAAISMAELNQAAKGQLQKVETQIYQIKKRALDGLIEEKLMENAAAKAGKDTKAYLEEQIDSKIAEPTEKEVKALYEARKGKIKQPFEEAKDQIIAYLRQNRMSRAHLDLISKLRSEAKVQIMLEPPRIEIDTGGYPAVGESGAKIALVEFSDYQCPYCRRVRPVIWRLMDEYKDKIRYVFLDFPLSFHREAKKAHEAARCAGDQGKYYEYNKKVFNNQEAIGVEDLKNYAKQLDLNTEEFDKCLDSGKHSRTVEDLTMKGVNAGVSGTPAFFINGIMLSGAQPYESFKEVIDGELSR